MQKTMTIKELAEMKKQLISMGWNDKVTELDILFVKFNAEDIPDPPLDESFAFLVCLSIVPKELVAPAPDSFAFTLSFIELAILL